jgi:ribosome-binding ATPase YchF (GTP1/OBG family)
MKAGVREDGPDIAVETQLFLCRGGAGEEREQEKGSKKAAHEKIGTYARKDMTQTPRMLRIALARRAGIVGLPNVGKSTLFNALTRTRKAEAANYPFCTIDPNVGVVVVPDERALRAARRSPKPASCPRRHRVRRHRRPRRRCQQGEGLGNQFLANIREVDAIVQVVRCFEDNDIIHTMGGVDPVRDIEIITTELVLADMRGRPPRQAHAPPQPGFPRQHPGSPRPRKRRLMKDFFLLSSKRTIFACNVAEGELGAATADPDSHPMVKQVRDYAASTFGAEAVVISARIEEEMTDLSPEEATEFLADMGVKDSGVSALIRAVYHLLGLRTYLTTGEKETRAWTITEGTKAPGAAGVIHGDFERGFIAAEVVHYDDLVSLGSHAKAREAGKLRIEGKEYVMKDGDVVEFRFNV